MTRTHASEAFGGFAAWATRIGSSGCVIGAPSLHAISGGRPGAMEWLTHSRLAISIIESPVFHLTARQFPRCSARVVYFPQWSGTPVGTRIREALKWLAEFEAFRSPIPGWTE